MHNFGLALFGLLAFVQVGLPRLYAVSSEAGALSGLMTQPNSQYLHFVRGGYLGLRSDDATWLWRLNYIERPYFATQNYGDGESGVFTLLGTRVYGSPSFHLSAWAGVGQMQGYMHALSANLRRSYRLPGLAAQVEASWKWQRFSLAVTQQSFVGSFSREELSSYVTWPFNFVLLRFGFAI